MSVKVAINGFGRIGRNILRAIIESERKDLEVVAINDLGSTEVNAHLLEFDSVHGKFYGDIKTTRNSIIVEGREIQVTSIKQPAALPWKNIDIAMECTGIFTDREKAASHLKNGCSRVLISAPAKNADKTIVYGVNHQQLSGNMNVVSAASCTTNAVVPVLATLDETFGIEAATITTIHSLMNDQPVLDAYHHTDLRKTRAASQSIIPVDTGLAVGIERILPQLAGKLSAHALRVPTTKVSAIELTVATERTVSSDQINSALREAAEGPLAGVLDYSLEPLASCDFAGEAASAIVDAKQTQVAAGRLAKILIWFDNEWAYASRMIDVALAWQQCMSDSSESAREGML